METAPDRRRRQFHYEIPGIAESDRVIARAEKIVDEIIDDAEEMMIPISEASYADVVNAMMKEQAA